MGVLCCRSTPEVHLAGKHIYKAVFLGRQWFHVSTATARDFENGNEYGKERPRINFMFATDRRSSVSLDNSSVEWDSGNTEVSGLVLNHFR